MNKIMVIPIVFLVFVVSLIVVIWKVTNHVDESELERFKQAFNQNEFVEYYFNSEVSIEQTSSHKLEDYTFYDYTVKGNVNEEFEKLSNEEKYNILLSLIRVLDRETNNDFGGSFDCGNKKVCGFEGVILYYQDKYYEMSDYEKGNADYLYSMDTNTEKVYRPNKQDQALDKAVDKILSESSSSSGSYISLTKSQKVDAWGYAQHVVKNNLKSPSSAKFPPFSDDFVKVSNGEINVISYVDAENSYGAKLRTNFIVTLDKDMNLIGVNIME